MVASRDTLAALRAALAPLEPGVRPAALPLFPLGLPALDGPLGGGLARGAVHDIYAEAEADAPAASGFALALAACANRAAPLVWVRQAMVEAEYGSPHGPGLAALGLDPARVVLIRAGDAAEALKAAEDAARTAAVATVVLDLWGEPKALDLTASRRLALAAAQTGATLFMTRLAAAPAPSAAASRWAVRAAASRPFEAGAPGLPAFAISLLRHRSGLMPRLWRVEWDRDQCRFRDAAPLSRRLDALPAGRAPAPRQTGLRRAG